MQCILQYAAIIDTLLVKALSIGNLQVRSNKVFYFNMHPPKRKIMRTKEEPTITQLFHNCDLVTFQSRRMIQIVYDNVEFIYKTEV